MDRTDREIKYQHYIDDFYKIACKVLADKPKELKEFNYRWKNREYRRAYMPYMTNVDENQLTKKEKKIDEEFYGLFVN